MLDTETVRSAVRTAVELGFQQVAFSGGEPLLHPDIGSMAAHAKSLGLRVVLTTNGTLTARSTWKDVAPHLDLVAVSIDGQPETHNRMRNSDTAFARMREGLERIGGDGVPFGLIHTLTSASLPELAWLASFAMQVDAQLLQLHPLGRVGAASSLDTLALDGEGLAKARIVVLQLQICCSVPIHLDVFNRESVSEDPGLIYAWPDEGVPGEREVDAPPNPLVVTAEGMVHPVCHEMPPACSLGSLHEADLGSLYSRWAAAGGRAAFHAHCTRTWARVGPQLHWPYFNWYEELERAASPRGSLPVLVD